MSDELFPTKTRLALLQDVADGAVHDWWHYGRGVWKTDLDLGPGENPRYRNVQSRITDLQRAGWVVCGGVDPNYRYGNARRWELTDLGRSILDGA